MDSDDDDELAEFAANMDDEFVGICVSVSVWHGFDFKNYFKPFLFCIAV